MQIRNTHVQKERKKARYQNGKDAKRESESHYQTKMYEIIRDSERWDKNGDGKQ